MLTKRIPKFGKLLFDHFASNPCQDSRTAAIFTLKDDYKEIKFWYPFCVLWYFFRVGYTSKKIESFF